MNQKPSSILCISLTFDSTSFLLLYTTATTPSFPNITSQFFIHKTWSVQQHRPGWLKKKLTKGDIFRPPQHSLPSHWFSLNGSTSGSCSWLTGTCTHESKSPDRGWPDAVITYQHSYKYMYKTREYWSKHWPRWYVPTLRIDPWHLTYFFNNFPSQ